MRPTLVASCCPHSQGFSDAPLPEPMPPPPITRSRPAQVCPLLLRVFPRLGAHHQLEDFARRGDEPKDEVQVYTWMDATLR